MELALNGAHIRIDVRVIELQIIEHERSRAVMDELGALVEEGRVVLVSLDHEIRRPAKTRAHAKVLGHAADQKSRLEPGVLQNPSEHRCGGRLAVCARNRKHPAILEQLVRQPFGTGSEGYVAVKQRLNNRLSAPHDVAHQHRIRSRMELGSLEALDDGDAKLGELRAHRRINVMVRTSDAVSRSLGERRDSAHERAADSKYVDMHQEAVQILWTCARGRISARA